MDPLKYNISNWYDLKEVISNTSVDLKIYVSEYIQNDELQGIKVRVNHNSLGDIFTCIINPTGNIVMPDEGEDTTYLTTKNILDVLYKFGFFVNFIQEDNLSESQITLLSTLKELKYDKLRLMVVYDDNYENSVTYVCAFNIAANPEWINVNRGISNTEWVKALSNGSAFNVSGVSDPKLRWDWLYGKLADIQDILDRNNNE